MKMKIINSILKIITIVILFSSCNTKNTYVEEVFGGQYRLPEDFKLALEYIDTELDEYEKTYAYQQLIIENSQSFYFDFNTVKNAPSFTTSPDGKLRIYHFYQGMHTSPPILQFCNSKGKIITTHITSESLYSTTDLENITTKEYKYGDFSGYAEILGMIKMKKRTIYLLFLSDYHYFYVLPNELCEFIVGLQLTDKGYNYVPIFENSSSGKIYKSEEDESIKRIRFINGINQNLQHGSAWYNKDAQTLYIPYTAENYEEKFYSHKWNPFIQKFESITQSGYSYSPNIHNSLGITYGLEIILFYGDLLIRIDKDDFNAPNTYKYVAWGKGKTMADSPDLILHGGILNHNDGTIHFINKEYEYIVPCADNIYNNKLVIKKNKKIILVKNIRTQSE